MNINTENFYSNLTPFLNFHDFSISKFYKPLPTDWFVVITDVQGSTQAIQAGKYKDVNALGVASIVAIMNAVKPLKIPFVFGGDGATFCIPPSLKEKVENALLGTKQMAEKSLNLSLRIGIVQMKTILENGGNILVGKFQATPHYEQTMFMGEGMTIAEALIKNDNQNNQYWVQEKAKGKTIDADFSGFECRWNEVPSIHGETVAILIKVLEKKNDSPEKMYPQIMNEIVSVYGTDETHHPLRVEGLNLSVSPFKLSTENKIRSSFVSFWKRLINLPKTMMLSALGNWLMRHNTKTETVNWGSYKKILIANTDYRKFDGVLRMVVSGTEDQRLNLRAKLELHRQAGKIVFGLYPSPSALITCVISNYGNEHVHFLDGSEGGYTMAGKELKEQLLQSSIINYPATNSDDDSV